MTGKGTDLCIWISKLMESPLAIDGSTCLLCGKDCVHSAGDTEGNGAETWGGKKSILMNLWELPHQHMTSPCQVMDSLLLLNAEKFGQLSHLNTTSGRLRG